jgi:ATP-dependent DNA helicase RecG
MPMSDAELLSLLVGIESDCVERKESYSGDVRDKARRAVCSFANDLPGHQRPGIIFIGARDNGSPAGLTITDELLQQLASIRDDGRVLPFPSLTVERRIINGSEFAVVTVTPSRDVPVRYDQRVWVRVGPTTRLASPEDERILAERRSSANLPGDLRPCAECTLTDLDLSFFRNSYLPSAIAPDVLAANQRSIEQQLATCRFVAGPRDLRPTLVGCLVLAFEPRRAASGAYVQFVRFDGMDLTSPIVDQAEIGGSLPDLLRALDEKLRAHIRISTNITLNDHELRRPDYPLAALQQLARNAVMHRSFEGTNAPIRISWFSDRIEIQNPGGPFGQVTQENFGRPGVTDYRNPHLAEAMKVLGYVQRFGVGIATARGELAANGSPNLEFQINQNFVHVTVRTRS